MESVIERINKNQFYNFPGGIHPPEQKFLTNDKPIKSLPLPNELIIPLQQHIGLTGTLLVKEGDDVLKGQPLTSCNSPMSVPVHAPTSGIIKAIKPSTIAHPSGMSQPCIFLQPDGNDTWCKRKIVENFKTLTKKEIVEKIANAGISGMGGAGFPTNVKLNTQHSIKFLIINAAECEPYITADDLLIREHSTTVINGIEILDYLLSPEIILIGIEDNKPEAIAALKSAAKVNPKIRVCVLPTKYPTGGEKQLIQALTGNEVPSGVPPVTLGMVVQNVATVFAISEAIVNDIPMIRRVVTVTGMALEKPQNLWVLLGTQVDHLLESCGYQKQAQHRIIMGGPLMGYTLPNLNVPIVKTSNCILAPTVTEIEPTVNELECIRCGQCAEACPASLLPQELQWHAKAKGFDKLKELNLFDCIECGACAYVCPSQIPLVKYYRVAKAEIRNNNVQELKAEKAKLRFEARKVRLEKEKQAREDRHKKAIAARKAASFENPEKSNSTTSAVAAALARVKAKKAQAAESSGDAPADTKSMAAQAIARAKARKAAKSKQAQPEITENTEVKTLAAQAIARAKAKQAEKATATVSNSDSATGSDPDTQTPKSSEAALESVSTTVDPAKAKRLAAIARAKAKKAETVEVVSKPVSTPVESDTVDLAKAKRLAAIARAKAKKAEAVEVASESVSTPVESDTVDLAKAKRLAAIARAKAKKAEAVEVASESVSTTIEPDMVDPVKAKRLAAIARAKAKKAEQAAAKLNVTDNAEAVQAIEIKETAKASKTLSEPVSEPVTNEADNIDPAKAKRLAVIARAKAKAKKAKESSNSEKPAELLTENLSLELTLSDVDNFENNDEKVSTKVANSIAKSEEPTTAPKKTLTDEQKKLKIAAAIAKAKAKKQKESK